MNASDFYLKVKTQIFTIAYHLWYEYIDMIGRRKDFKVATLTKLFSTNFSDFLYDEEKSISFTSKEKKVCLHSTCFRIKHRNNDIWKF